MTTQSESRAFSYASENDMQILRGQIQSWIQSNQEKIGIQYYKNLLSMLEATRANEISVIQRLNGKLKIISGYPTIKNFSGVSEGSAKHLEANRALVINEQKHEIAQLKLDISKLREQNCQLQDQNYEVAKSQVQQNKQVERLIQRNQKLEAELVEIYEQMDQSRTNLGKIQNLLASAIQTVIPPNERANDSLDQSVLLELERRNAKTQGGRRPYQRFRMLQQTVEQ